MSAGEKQIPVAGQVVTAAAASVNARVRRNLAVQSLLAASRFSRNVGVIELSNKGADFGPFFDEIMHNATACVLLSVASIEAYANELFIDGDKTFPKLPPATVNEIWSLSEQESTLKKFERVLALREAAPFDKGAKPYQSVTLLVALRNALTHFKAEWHDEDGSHARLSRKVDAIFKPGAPYFSNEGMFPVRWMTHKNTQWVVTATVEFLKEFETRGGIDPRMDYSTLDY